MFVAGEYIPVSHPLHKPGSYASWDDVVRSQPTERDAPDPIPPELADIREELRAIYAESDSRQAGIRRGFVYIIIHPLFEGWVSVGRSIDPIRRLSDYNRGDPFRRYILWESVYFEDRLAAEIKIHSVLAGVADARRGEWFRCSPEQALAAAHFVQNLQRS